MRQTLESLHKTVNAPIELHGGRLEDHYLVDWAEREGRIIPDGTLAERAEDALRYLEFLGFIFIRT